MKRTYIDYADIPNHGDKVLLAADKGDLELWGAWN